MKKNNNSGHRTGSSRQNISGEIDFGKDGRIVVKQTNGSDKSQRTYKISDNSSYRLTVGDKVIFTMFSNSFMPTLLVVVKRSILK